MLIAHLPGDGIGPEVTRAALRVLREVADARGEDVRVEDGLIGAAAIEATGEALPAATIELCQRADGVLLGAVGDPRYGPHSPVRPEQGLLDLRQQLGLFANLRSARARPGLEEASPLKADRVTGTDMMIVRELSGGVYFGARTRTATGACDVWPITVEQIQRITRVAGRLARERGGRLLSVDKANVLETSRLWREVVTEIVADEFAEVALTHEYVDAAAMHLISKPATFDVIVTDNIFGDILSDEASVLAGSLGMLPSISLGTADRGNKVLAEPVHGSAPDIMGTGSANPIGAILSVAALCRHALGWATEADAIERAVEVITASGPHTPDLAMTGCPQGGTTDVADAVVAAWRANVVRT